jgi:hypothetical protein
MITCITCTVTRPRVSSRASTALIRARLTSVPSVAQTYGTAGAIRSPRGPFRHHEGVITSVLSPVTVSFLSSTGNSHGKQSGGAALSLGRPA